MPEITSIRGKVALLLSVLVLVIIYMSVSRIAYLRDKEATFLTLTETSRAGAESVRELRIVALDLDELALRAIRATDLFELSDIGVTLVQTLDAARSSISGAMGAEGQSADVGNNLLRFEEGLQDAVAKRAAFLQARESFIAKQSQLTSTLDVLNAELNHLNLAFRVPASPRVMISAEQVELGIALRIKLSTLLDRGRVLATLKNPSRTRTSISELTPVIGESLRTLSAVGKFEGRDPILRLLQSVRANIQSEDGLQANSDRVVAAEAEFNASAQKLRSYRTEINQTLHSMVEGTEENIARIFEATRIESRRAIRSELFLSWGVGIGVILAVWLVFLQQVSRRIEVLSRDVVRIADGDLDTPTSIVGRDEIGRMGEALKIFRNNARELRSSNKQLREFAYAASHDLRSPLRAIHDLASWTIEDAEGQISPSAERNINLIKERAERLSRLLSDLLAYARAGPSQIERTSVDLLRLTRDIAELSDPSRQFSVTYSGVRFINSYPTPLNTILLNLVSNAIKHHDQDSGSVAVHGKFERGNFVMEIHDDGPGIGEGYHETIFEMFQTLHSQEESGGSGMGLALVRKLAQAMDGKISVNSNPKQRRGTIFTLTIPIGKDNEVTGSKDSTLHKGEAA